MKYSNRIQQVAVISLLLAITGITVPGFGWSPLEEVGKNGAGTVSDSSLRAGILERTLPGTVKRNGEAAAFDKILNDPVKRAQAVGRVAESDFVERNPDWHLTKNPNAPQNDVWTRTNDALEGGQIKTHIPGREAQYLRDMLKDNKAESFLVPDDQYVTIRQRIQDRIQLMQERGNQSGVVRWERELQRLKPMGRSYAELDRSVVRCAQASLRNARILGAARTGIAGGAIVVVVEGGSAVYRSLNGELTPSETRDALLEVGAKASVVSFATGAAVLLGANPIGLTVLVVGAVAYLIADYAIDQLRENWGTSPLTVAQINAAMPEGWALADAFSNAPLHLQSVSSIHEWNLLLPEAEGSGRSSGANQDINVATGQKSNGSVAAAVMSAGPIGSVPLVLLIAGFCRRFGQKHKAKQSNAM